MAFEDTTAGMSTLTDPNSAAPVAPAIGPAAPATTPALFNGGQDQLGAVAPPVSGGGMIPPTGSGVSPSMRDQLAGIIAKNSNNLMASSPNPNAPMAWAKSWLAGSQAALSGAISSLGDASTAPVNPGGGWLEGVERTMANRNERLGKQKDQAAKQKQQDIENQREDQRLQMERESHNMAITMNQLAIGKTISAADREQADELYNNIYKPWAEDMKNNKGVTSIAQHLTQQGVIDLAAQHKSADDPTGMKWLNDQQKIQDGWETVTDANGDPIPERDARGNLTGHNMRKQTFAVATWGDPAPASEEFSKDLKNYLGQNIAPGTVLDPRVAALYKVQIGKIQADEQAADKLALEAGQTKEGLAELQQKADYRQAGKDFLPWFQDAKGDELLALRNLQLHAQEVGPDGKQTPEAAKAAETYDLVSKTMGPEIMTRAADKFDKEEEASVAAAAKNSHNKDLATGNTDLTGDAYLASIPNKGEAALVKSIGEGLVEPDRMEYLIARNPGLMQDLSLAYSGRGLDTTKFHGYLDAVKKYTTDTKIAGQLNSARVGFRHLKALYDDNNTPGAFIAGTKAYAQRDVDLTDASKELARFLTGGTAPSKDEIKSAEDSLNPSILSFDPQASRQTAVKAQADRIREKVEEYRSQWRDALPNPNWARPMPGWSQDAQNAMDYIHYDGKPPITQPESSALPSGTEVKNSATPQTFTVPIPGPGNQVAHFATQAQADQFQAELARQVQRLNNAQ